VPINVGELIRERDAVLKQLNGLEPKKKKFLAELDEERTVLRGKASRLNQLIVLYDPMAEIPPDSVQSRKPRILQGEVKECLVPGCPEQGNIFGRCKQHYGRWTTSEKWRQTPGAAQCKHCPEEAGQWVKYQIGLSMHNRYWHPELVGAA